MATAISSARTGMSRVNSAFRKSSTAKPAASGQSRCLSVHNTPKQSPLIAEMHRKLYPHLYDKRGEPTQTIHPPSQKKARSPGSAVDTSRPPSFKLTKPSPAIKKTCPDPVKAVTTSQITLLDPTGTRTRLFSKDNPECAKVGDILLVRQRTGDPFAGVCINIRRRGADTAILLRGQLTRVGVEMWFKVYSPLVEGIEIVDRAKRRARRARLTYMRKVKHDRGSVENVVRVYLRQKAALGTGEGGKRKGGMAGMGGKKGGKKGKKR